MYNICGYTVFPTPNCSTPGDLPFGLFALTKCTTGLLPRTISVVYLNLCSPKVGTRLLFVFLLFSAMFMFLFWVNPCSSLPAAVNVHVCVAFLKSSYNTTHWFLTFSPSNYKPLFNLVKFTLTYVQIKSVILF